MSHGKYSPEFRAEGVREVAEKSRPIAVVARELNLVPQTLSSWVAAHRRQGAGGEEGFSTHERGRIRELERRVRELEEENHFRGESPAFFAKTFRWPRSLTLFTAKNATSISICP